MKKRDIISAVTCVALTSLSVIYLRPRMNAYVFWGLAIAVCLFWTPVFAFIYNKCFPENKQDTEIK